MPFPNYENISREAAAQALEKIPADWMEGKLFMKDFWERTRTQNFGNFGKIRNLLAVLFDNLANLLIIFLAHPLLLIRVSE